MSSMNKAVSLALAPLLACALAAGYAHAETIQVNGQIEVAKSDVQRPSGGMTMAAVEARFGAPLMRHPTVGTPPITRWDYSKFAVFFEKDRVIDAVVPGTTAADRAGGAAEHADTSEHADATAAAPAAATSAAPDAPAAASGAPPAKSTPAAAPAAASAPSAQAAQTAPADQNAPTDSAASAQSAQRTRTLH